MDEPVEFSLGDEFADVGPEWVCAGDNDEASLADGLF